MDGKVFEVEHLTKIYSEGEVVANDDLSFGIDRGEIFGLLGPNGAGKTTLLKQLLGLIRPTSGSIRLFGADVVNNAEIVPYYVSSMAQRPTALADLRVREALEVTGRLRMMDARTARGEAVNLIEEFELVALADRIIGRLSQGQQRLVSLALALVGGLPVMVLDEPTNDLDPRHRKQLWDKLLELNGERGTTIILVTHNVVEAERVLERVGIINSGRIMALGSVEALKRRVEGQIRLELVLNEDQDEDHICRVLEHRAPGRVMRAGDRRLTILSGKDTGPSAAQSILSSISLDALSDFRIFRPTLEDVYLQLEGAETPDVHHVSN